MAANPNYKKLRLPQLKKGQSPSEVQNKIKIFTDFVNSENPSPMLSKGMVMDWEKQPKNIRSFLERQGIYSRLVECSQKDSSKRVSQPPS